MNYILDVNNLCKTYVVNKRQNNVLKNVNFKLEEGEMVAVMGPSGSGKSTLLYTVSGMDELTAGTVRFQDRELNKMTEKELADLRLNKMGFIFQQMYMLKNLTVLDNILLPAMEQEKAKLSKKEKLQYAKELMRKFDILEIADNDITEVSGGQLQRACIIRSLMNRPQIIFADEPTGALNQSASREVMDMLNKVNSEGTAIMMVTHDVRVASRCTRVLYLVDGSIRGEYHLDRYDPYDEKSIRDRERQLTNWLSEMGW